MLKERMCIHAHFLLHRMDHPLLCPSLDLRVRIISLVRYFVPAWTTMLCYGPGVEWRLQHHIGREGDGGINRGNLMVCGMQDDDIPGIVRYHTYEVLKKEVNNPRLRWAYLPYSMHMAGPREAIQHMIIRKNYGAHLRLPTFCCAMNSHLMLRRLACIRCSGLEWTLFILPLSCGVGREGMSIVSNVFTDSKVLGDACRMHALHHRARHGGLQELAHRRGLLRPLRCAGHSQGQRQGAGR